MSCFNLAFCLLSHQIQKPAAMAGTSFRATATSTSPRGRTGMLQKGSAACTALTWPALPLTRNNSLSTVSLAPQIYPMNVKTQ